MVVIEFVDDNVEFQVQGLHKIWAMKGKVTVKKENILFVHPYVDLFGYRVGWRMPGTSIPGVITAGTYILNGDNYFWDVCNKKKSIMVTLKNEHYKMLIVQVENVEESLEKLRVKSVA